MKDNMKKNYLWNTIGALTISLTSLVYTMILTRTCSLDEVGLFSFGFSFACMMVTLASFGGRTYQVTDTRNEIKTSTYIIARYITVIFSYLLVIIFLLFKNYSFQKLIIILVLCIFKFLEELSDVYYGIMQKNKELYKVGQFQFIKSIINVILFFVGVRYIDNLITSIILITINNMIFVLLIERTKSKQLETWKFEFDKKQIIKLLKINFFICGYTFLSSYLINAPKYAIDNYLSSDMQAMFNMLIMPATLMFLIGGFIVNPILVDIAEKHEENRISEIKSILKKIFLLLTFFGIAALIGTYFLGTWALEIVYSISFKKYRYQLMLVILGAIFYTFTTILGTIFIAFRKIKIQLFIALICCVVAYALSDILVLKYGLIGGFYSYLITMIFRMLCYIPLLINLFRREE